MSSGDRAIVGAGEEAEAVGERVCLAGHRGCLLCSPKTGVPASGPTEREEAGTQAAGQEPCPVDRGVPGSGGTGGEGRWKDLGLG